MRRKKTLVGLCYLTMVTALLLLVGCSADCELSATVRTWVDQNENGVWDTDESPLSAVKCFIDSPYGVGIGEAVSDQNGEARLSVMLAGCPKGAVFSVYVDPPSGYRLTTQTRLPGRQPVEDPFVFGFAPINE